MQKILLYYIFTPIADPPAVQLWQKTLGEKLGLRGRIIISQQGLNGTVGGEIAALKAYIQATKTYPSFQAITFKWSTGSVTDFPRLSVKVRSEIVTFGQAGSVAVDEQGVVGGGQHLTPQQVHELVAKRGDDVVFFDGRNVYEAAVGKFKNAIITAVQHTRDFAAELDKPEYDAVKTKPVVTYCTGGVRCEVLSALMKQRGFQEVYQIDGGIAKYGETYGDDGLWEGALYVFDDRVTTKFTDAAQDIGVCIHCGQATSQYKNCALVSCNKQVLICETCWQDPIKHYHQLACAEQAHATPAK